MTLVVQESHLHITNIFMLFFTIYFAILLFPNSNFILLVRFYCVWQDQNDSVFSSRYFYYYCNNIFSSTRTNKSWKWKTKVLYIIICLDEIFLERTWFEKKVFHYGFSGSSEFPMSVNFQSQDRTINQTE